VPVRRGLVRFFGLPMKNSAPIIYSDKVGYSIAYSKGKLKYFILTTIDICVIMYSYA
jgi:hypothetical protein